MIFSISRQKLDGIRLSLAEAMKECSIAKEQNQRLDKEKKNLEMMLEKVLYIFLCFINFFILRLWRLHQIMEFYNTICPLILIGCGLYENNWCSSHL